MPSTLHVCLERRREAREGFQPNPLVEVEDKPETQEVAGQSSQIQGRFPASSLTSDVRTQRYLERQASSLTEAVTAPYLKYIHLLEPQVMKRGEELKKGGKKLNEQSKAKKIQELYLGCILLYW